MDYQNNKTSSLQNNTYYSPLNELIIDVADPCGNSATNPT